LTKMSEAGDKVSSDQPSVDNRPIFRDINADDADPEIMELESLCMNCHEQGQTRLFLTRIPFFREVVIASFACDHCHFKNAELQPSSTIQDRGVNYKLNVTNIEDLNRQVVQTATASVEIPSLGFEIPPQKSKLTTIEGVIQTSIDGLEQDQVLRRIQHPELAAKLDEFIEKLRVLLTVAEPFQLIIDDPTGNSFLENPFAPSKDPHLVVGHYSRTHKQDVDLGIISEDAEVTGTQILGQDDGEGLNTQNEVMSFRTNCPDCQAPCETNMKLVNIPHFKEVVIMATNCEACGHRDNEVKSSGGIEKQGVRYELTILNREDVARDVLKSETASLAIPELDFETEMGTLGGKFTTVEGLLEDIKSQLKTQNPFFHGDSSQPSMVGKLSDFCDKIDEIISCKRTNVKFILDDPAGNSFILSLCAPDPDPQLVVTSYERTFEQNEDLGLNDMKTENYDET